MKLPKQYGHNANGKTYQMENTLKHLQPEREKILDDVLKMLEREVNILNRSHLPHLTFGLKHAILMIKDLKK